MSAARVGRRTAGTAVTPWKLPPTAKVYEALSAVAEGRVHITGAGRAEVESSGREQTYSVEWSDDLRTVSANCKSLKNSCAK